MRFLPFLAALLCASVTRVEAVLSASSSIGPSYPTIENSSPSPRGPAYLGSSTGTFFGKADPGATVTISVDGASDTSPSTRTIEEWAYSVTNLATGKHTIKVTASTPEANEASVTKSFYVLPPVLTYVSHAVTTVSCPGLLICPLQVDTPSSNNFGSFMVASASTVYSQSGAAVSTAATGTAVSKFTYTGPTAGVWTINVMVRSNNVDLSAYNNYIKAWCFRNSGVLVDMAAAGASFDGNYYGQQMVRASVAGSSTSQVILNINAVTPMSPGDFIECYIKSGLPFAFSPGTATDSATSITITQR